MMILGLLAIGFLVYYLMDGKHRGSVLDLTTRKETTATEILKQRFVNGEIDEKAYLQMSETIK